MLATSAHAETISVGVTAGPHAEIIDAVKIAKVANTVGSPQGVYSQKYKKLDDLPEGARVAIANDPSNGARGLMILALHGVIKLKDPNDVASTIADITDNPKKLRFVDLVAINNNYAVQAGLNPAKDAVAQENADGPGSTSSPSAKKTRTSLG